MREERRAENDPEEEHSVGHVEPPFGGVFNATAERLLVVRQRRVMAISEVPVPGVPGRLGS
jgi:hypothetical protein